MLLLICSKLTLSPGNAAGGTQGSAGLEICQLSHTDEDHYEEKVQGETGEPRQQDYS